MRSTDPRLLLPVIAFLGLITVNVAVWAAMEPTNMELRRATDIFEFRSGVIIDANGPVAYLMSLDRGIDAVELSSGKLLWHTVNAAKPLLLHDRRLVAQTEPAAPDNSLRIVILDVQDAGKVLREAKVQLPEAVQVSVDDGLGTAFHASASLHEDKVVIRWRYSRREVGGARSGPDAEISVANGAVRIDPGTGRAETLGPEQVPTAPEPELPDDIAPLIELEMPRGPLRHVDDVLAALERGSYKGQPRTILKRWHSGDGQAMPDVLLFDDGFTYRSTSADSRHFLASKRVAAGDPGWAWRVFSFKSGQQAAEVLNNVPSAPFFITASSLIHEAQPTEGTSRDGEVIDHPLRLRAIDLKNSDELWEQPIRDTTYRGPYPPGADSPGRR